MEASPKSTGPLAGIKVLDLSRVLAGPWCSQTLGDLGADIIKVEQPGQGDDSRRWGPPFLADDSRDSAYYACANRNKRSIAINIAAPEGAALIRKLAADADIVLENFRVGSLAKNGLDYAALRAANPALIYCSVTGFGQDGPNKDLGGYDFLIQGMSGLMSVTGRPDGEPGGGAMKVGIPISDMVTGLYATISILAALHHRNATGLGQHIDVALLDSQVALLGHQASNYLNGGMVPGRLANEHANVVPYRTFLAADGEVIVALGNDSQFRAFCGLLSLPALADDDRFVNASGRSLNRAALYAALEPAVAKWRAADFMAAMEAAKLPAGQVSEVPEVLGSPQIKHRGMVHELERRDGTPVKVVGFPGKFSETPPDYRYAPPRLGQDTAEVLREKLQIDDQELSRLQALGVVA